MTLQTPPPPVHVTHPNGPLVVMSDDLLERLSRLSFDDSHADLVDQVVKGLTDGQISLPDVMQSLS